MKIKKTFQGSAPENKILNTKSSSQTDTYSCDYINAELAPNIMTASLHEDISLSTSVQYNNLVLEELNSVGNKLSIAQGTYGTGIKIGSGISKVLISANVAIKNDHTGPLLYNLYTYKNNQNMGYARIQIETGATESISLPPMLCDCTKNDVFTLRVYKATTSAPSSMTAGGSYNRTYLTVEAVA